MIQLGVRRNDFGILWRANRYQKKDEEESLASIMGAVWFLLLFTAGFTCVVIFDFMIVLQSGKRVAKVLAHRRTKRLAAASASGSGGSLKSDQSHVKSDQVGRADVVDNVDPALKAE